MSEQNKTLIRRYFEVIDSTEDWDDLDEFLAPGFVDHDPVPGYSPDRDGMKQAAAMFKVATPGHHVIEDQVAEGDKVVTRVRGVGTHGGELFGIPATGKDIEAMGIAIHRIEDGKIVEHWSVVDMAALLGQIGAPPAPPD